jgi:NAD+ synthase (glutamine-hydrolysing)
LPSYDLLDPVLEQYLEEGRCVQEIIDGGADPAVVHRIVGLINRGEYKRRQAAPGIRVTTRAFGVDIRMPMTSGFQE